MGAGLLRAFRLLTLIHSMMTLKMMAVCALRSVIPMLRSSRHARAVAALAAAAPKAESKIRSSSITSTRLHSTAASTFDEDTLILGRKIITYITDVEGDKHCLERYVRQSKALRFVTCEPRWDENDLTRRNSDGFYFPYDHAIDFHSDQEILVYGGDVWDKGMYVPYV